MLLEVSRAAYYAHHGGAVPARQPTDEELTEHIRQAHQAAKGRYGAHASTPNCVVAGTAMAANGWPGCCAPPGCVAAPRAAASAPRFPTRPPPPARIWSAATLPSTPRRHYPLVW